jgi:predicted enzyme related to lactoylglutathione lyase
MAYRNGRFVWFELVTPNVDDGVAFWTEVTGLGVTEMPMGPVGTNKMFTRDGKTQAGAAPPQMPGVPPHWLSYVSVDSVDDKHAAVGEHGGRSIVPPTDIPNIGRFAIVADPEGAVFALFRGSESDDGGATAFAWNELWCKDPAKVLAFYTGVFGYTSTVMAMPTGPYHVLKVGEESVAGVMASPDPKVPPMWLPYLAVDDADATIARARGQQGSVHMEPMTVENVGRFGIVADRQGAVLGVLKPAQQ